MFLHHHSLISSHHNHRIFLIDTLMDSIKNTESLTRFLRSKDPSLSEIITIASKLLHNELSIRLPKKEIFLLELICDRLNDNGPKFKSWKFSIDVWHLLQEVWNKLSFNIGQRDRVFRRLKILEILTKIFSEFYECSSIQFYFQLYSTINSIFNDFEFDFDEPQALALLTSFCNLYQLELPFELAYNWTELVKSLYDYSRNSIDFVPSKKNLTRFTQTCFPVMLTAINNMDEEDYPIVEILKDIIKRTLFTKGSVNGLIPNCQQLFNSGKLPPQHLGLFYQIIIDNIGNKDVKTCEEIFLLVNKNDNYRAISESLIAVLAKSNRPLSKSFLLSVYEETITKDDINWNIIGHVLKLDLDVAMEKYSEILDKLILQNEKVIVDVGEKLITSFVEAREFFEFITEVWPNLLAKGYWNSIQIITIVSSNINNLSGSQLQNIFTTINPGDVAKNYPILLAVAKGLFGCSQTKIDMISEVIFNRSIFDTNEFWELKYLLVTIYGDKVKDVVNIRSENPVLDPFYFYYIFRLNEMASYEVELLLSFKQQFIEYFNTSQNETEDMSKMLIERWPIILNNHFEADEMKQVIRRIFTCSQLQDYLLEFFNDDGDIFYEQRYLISNTISVLYEMIKEDHSPFATKVVSYIPNNCFPRDLKINLLNSFTENIQQSADSSSLVSIKHLLVLPSHRTLIETDFTTLMSLVAKYYHSSNMISIFKSIWLNQSRQSKGDSTYCLKALELLNKKYKTLKTNQNLHEKEEVLTTGLILSVSVNDNGNLSSEVSEALQKLYDNHFELLSKALEYLIEKNSDSEFLLWSLNEFNHMLQGNYNKTKLLTLVKVIGEVAQSSEVKQKLFKILCKGYDANFNCGVHLVTIFCILESEAPNSDIVQDLQSYFKRVSEENTSNFNLLAEYVLFSIDKDINSATSTFPKLVITIIRSLTKTNDKSIYLLSSYLSLVLTHFDALVAPGFSSIYSILDTLKLSLSDMVWCFNQYSIELVVSLVTRIAASFFHYQTNHLRIETYILATQVLAHIVLFHRYRMTSRHHSIMAAFVALLKPLSLRKGDINDALSSSSLASQAYSRVLNNLCQPLNMSKMTSQLTTAASVIKRDLRNHLHVLLLNYISLSLKNNFSPITNENILPGIFSVFDILSQRELEITNRLLDVSGTALFKALYNDYKDRGKWQDA